MTRADLNLEALQDLITMRHVQQLTFWHDAQLRYSLKASGYGYPQ